MQDFFAEKLLELLERKCRYEIFGCDCCTKVSSDLVEHETSCHRKPPVPVKRRNKKESNYNNEENENRENEIDEDDDEDLNEEDDCEGNVE